MGIITALQFESLRYYENGSNCTWRILKVDIGHWRLPKPSQDFRTRFVILHLALSLEEHARGNCKPGKTGPGGERSPSPPPPAATTTTAAPHHHRPPPPPPLLVVLAGSCCCLLPARPPQRCAHCTSPLPASYH